MTNIAANTVNMITATSVIRGSGSRSGGTPSEDNDGCGVSVLIVIILTAVMIGLMCSGREYPTKHYLIELTYVDGFKTDKTYILPEDAWGFQVRSSRGSYYAVYYTKSNGDIFNLITQEESLCDGVIRLKVKDVW